MQIYLVISYISVGEKEYSPLITQMNTDNM